MKQEHRIAIIGGGNMAQAFIGGLARREAGGDLKLAVCEVRPERREELASRFGVEAHGEIGPCVRGAALVMLAVKPQDLGSVLRPLGQALPRENAPVVVSIAAGVPLSVIAAGLPAGVPLVRVMPNLPALVGRGVLGYFVSPQVGGQARALCLRVLEAVGRAFELREEALLDAVTALSGSGPAFVFDFVRGLALAGEALGLDAELSRALALETLNGSGAVLAQSGDPVETWIQRVASKGGTTEQGLRVLAERDLEGILRQTLLAARDRAREMARQYGKA